MGCEKFEGDQTIPSYIHIDTIKMADNPSLLEGRLTNNFPDVWVYVDQQVLGCYELPATIPVLADGPHEIALYGGIKFNTMSGTRGIYPFTAPKIVDEFNFVKDSVIVFNPTVKYYDNTDFVWIEEFDFTNPETISLIESSSSDTTLSYIYRDTDDPLYGRLGSQSGIGYVDAKNRVFEVTTHVEPENGFTFPQGVSPVMLEMEFNINNTMMVGLFIRDNGIIQHPVVVLKSTDGEWKKAYINFTPTISANFSATNFNVFFRADWDGSSETGVIMLDNIKLLRKE